MAAYLNIVNFGGERGRKRKYYQQRKDHTLDENISDKDIHKKYRFTRGKLTCL